MVNDIKSVLQHTRLGKLLTEKQLEALIAFGTVVSFHPGQTILHQGKKGPGMYIILEGSALVTAKILGEGGTYIATLEVGNLIGEISLVDKAPCATSVLASNNVSCLLITASYFEALTIFNPNQKHKITRAITHEIGSRLFDIRNKIGNFIVSSPMTQRSAFSSVIKSLHHPTIVPMDEEMLHQFKSFMSFRNFNKDELHSLSQHSSLIRAPKDCNLINTGDKDSPVYIILRGAVQTSITEGNKAAKLSVLGPSSLFCNIQLLDETAPSIINYITCERVMLFKIEKEKIITLQNVNLELWYKLFELICKSFVALERAADKLDVRLNSELYNR